MVTLTVHHMGEVLSECFSMHKRKSLAQGEEQVNSQLRIRSLQNMDPLNQPKPKGNTVCLKLHTYEIEMYAYAYMIFKNLEQHMLLKFQELSSSTFT